MTSIGLDAQDLAGLGIDIENTVQVEEQDTKVEPLSTLVKGSLEARVLLDIYEGAPILTVPAPPGGGKSTLIAKLVRQMHVREGWKIVVATPTKASAASLALAIHEQVGSVMNIETGLPESQVKWAIRSQAWCPKELESSVRDAQIEVRTIASCARSTPKCDLMLIDEAWQSIYADVAPAADGADRVILVGDAGQIGPVNDIDTSLFTGPEAPHLQAPVVFAQKPYAVERPINVTYRLGADTVSVIAPLYDFEFTSKRPNRSLVHPTKGRLNELETIMFDQVATPNDEELMTNVASRAMGMIGSIVEVEGGENIELTDCDVAVLVSHNVQVTSLRAGGHRGQTAGKPAPCCRLLGSSGRPGGRLRTQCEQRSCMRDDVAPHDSPDLGLPFELA